MKSATKVRSGYWRPISGTVVRKFLERVDLKHVRPDRPALTIVRSGPYRFTRNPMYLSLCLLQVALGFILDGWIPLLFALVLMAILHFGVILREEKYLEAKFGEQYLVLKREVRRWI